MSDIQQQIEALGIEYTTDAMLDEIIRRAWSYEMNDGLDEGTTGDPIYYTALFAGKTDVRAEGRSPAESLATALLQAMFAATTEGGVMTREERYGWYGDSFLGGCLWVLAVPIINVVGPILMWLYDLNEGLAHRRRLRRQGEAP